MSDPTRVISIQSHVVSGYVGNRAATFPLQLLGYDVDVVNTVQFSNHTGYGFTNGHKTTPEQLSAVFDGLSVNGLASTYSRALTGYIPGAEALQVVAKQIRKIRDENPDLIYVLDPVMGDIGRGLYVSQEVVPIYKEMLRLATIITPNQFEVELLSGTTITSLPTLHTALHTLHSQNALPHVAFSSIPLPSSLVASLNLPSTPPSSYTSLLPSSLPPWYTSISSSLKPEDDILVCFASTARHDGQGELETWAFALPTVHGYFSGVGDLFSAMVLAHFENPDSATPSIEFYSPLAKAVSKALLAVQQILLRTHIHSLSNPTGSIPATPRPLHASATQTEFPIHSVSNSVIPTDNELDAQESLNPREPKRKAKRMRLRELRVIPERRLIVNTEDGWPGKKLDWNALLKN